MWESIDDSQKYKHNLSWLVEGMKSNTLTWGRTTGKGQQTYVESDGSYTSSLGSESLSLNSE